VPVAHRFDQKFDPEAVSGRVAFVSSRFCSEMVSNLTGTVKLSTMTLVRPCAPAAGEDVEDRYASSLAAIPACIRLLRMKNIPSNCSVAVLHATSHRPFPTKPESQTQSPPSNSQSSVLVSRSQMPFLWGGKPRGQLGRLIIKIESFWMNGNTRGSPFGVVTYLSN